MAASYERVISVSRKAGADYSGDTTGEFRFAVVNPNAVTNYVSPDIPGKWYGSPGGPPAIPAGNVLVNSSNGGYCPFVLCGKALPGEAIECAIAGRVDVICGGTVTVGAAVQSDANGAAIAQTGGGIQLGIALTGGVAGDIIDIIFNP